MKKTIALLLGALLCLLAATAAGGTAADPLISRAYLEGEFSALLETAISRRADDADALVRAAAGGQPGGPGAAAQAVTLKEQDVLSGSTGLTVTSLGGGIRLDIKTGAVVDATTGQEIPSGRQLELNHRYILAENTTADFAVTSPAAVICYGGSGQLTASARPDYYAISCALRSLNLFQGSGSGIGEGFDLYRAPTRGEGLVMFLRLLGEEAEALSCTYGHPFQDVPAWLDRYVAWAYHNGYANGIAPDQFGCARQISAVEYEEFLLRALGYSVAGVDDYSTSLERALNCGALTNGEYELLRQSDFLRAHVVYMSYYSLDMTLSGKTQTLAQRLADKGLVTGEQVAQAQGSVNSLRIY